MYYYFLGFGFFAFALLRFNQYRYYYLLTFGKFLSIMNLYRKRSLEYLFPPDNQLQIKKITINNGEMYNDLDIDKLKSDEDKYKSVEVFYTFMEKNYIIIFNNNNKISNFKFPMYDSNELKKYNSEAFSKNSDSIILADLTNTIENNYDSEVLISIIRELSGPKGNFYEDKGYNLNNNKKIIIDFINNQLNCNIEHTANIELLYSDGTQVKI